MKGDSDLGAMSLTQNPDPEVLARTLLDDLLNYLSPGDLLCIPTGRSPRNLYRLIREDSKNAQLWGSLRYLQLDEYLDPSGTIPSFRDELRLQIFDPLGVPHDQVFSIDPAGDPHLQANRLDQIFCDSGPPRASVLGLGNNGHIAFNEPGSDFSGYTVVDLAEETINTNFPEPRPGQLQALTISLDQILESDSIFLLVPQAEKSALLDRCLAGPRSPDLPASCLHDHPQLHVYRH